MVYRILKKLGISGTVASILMILVGIAIWFYPGLLEKLLAVYLVVVGIIRLAFPD